MRRDNIDRMKELMEQMAAGKKPSMPMPKSEPKEELKAEEAEDSTCEEEEGKKRKKRVVKKEE